MDMPIDLDSELQLTAVEIEHIAKYHMQASKVQSKHSIRS
jgi:hypothetical protein